MADKSIEDILNEGSVKITKASYSLQDKAGTGEIDPELIARAELVMEGNADDFKPLALEELARLARILQRIRTNRLRSYDVIQELIAPVMQLKANGAVFKFDLVSSLTGTMLSFLEHLDQLDDDVVALLDAHLASLQLVVAKPLRGTGGSDGQLLQRELEDAIGRYNKKHPVGFRDNLN